MVYSGFISCFKKRIPVIFFTGNHDSLFSWSNSFESKYIPVIEEICYMDGLKIPHDFEKIKLNDNLFLMGIHINEDTIEEYNFPQIKRILETLDNTIEKPEEIIFVSHVPGKLKFKNLGSSDILNLKKRYKFKHHYHGHCKDYYGEYLEEGVPTRSVHFNEEIFQDEE